MSSTRKRHRHGGLRRRRLDVAAAVAAPNGELSGIWRRVGAATLSCTADGAVTLSASVGSGDGAVTRTVAIAVDCEEQGALSGLDDATASGTGVVRVSDTFAVTPATAECTATATAAAPAVSAAGGGSRTVAVSLAAAAGEAVTSAVRVDCTPPGHAPVTASATFTVTYADSCDDPLGTLRDGVTARTGAIAADSGCTSPQRHRNGGSDATRYARRHTFELTSPASVRVELSDSASDAERLDTYLLVLAGHNQDGTGTVLGRNDDGIGTSDSRRFFPRLEPGRYTIEATTYAARATGAYDLRVTAQLEVTIDGLHGSTRVGTGPASDHFTVLPADATCTTSTGTVTEGDDGQRTLTVSLAALGDAEATVACTRTGYEPATATVTLTALDPVTTVSVRADTGGTCSTFTGTLDAGVDNKYECTMTRGGTLVLTADATGAASQATLGWSAAPGVGAVGGAQRFDAAVDAGTVQFTHTATAQVTCTTSADLTVSVDSPDDERTSVTRHTTAIAVTCKPPVQITNYTPGDRSGPGAMTGTFDVAPATAECRARNAGGIAGDPVPRGTGTNRTVGVTTTGTGWLDVEVECSNADYGTTTATARFRADDEAACTTALGTLWHGSTARTGTLSTTSCTSDSRTPVSATFYAHRYTFTMVTAGWVTIDVEGTGTGTAKLDAYAVLLYGHGSGGIERASDDDSGNGSNARLADLLLAPGKYTVEATTATNEATGAYRIRVQGDFAARAEDQPRHVLADVGQQFARTWAHLPATASVSVQSVTPEGLEATVTSDDGSATLTATATHAGVYTVTVAYTASGHASTITTTVDADCPPRHVETDTRTCTPLATTLPAGSAVASLNANGYWGLSAATERYSAYSTKAPAACLSRSESGAASYFRFTVPDRPGRLPVRVGVDSAEPRGGPLQVVADGGRPSLTIWRQSQSSLSFKAHSTTQGPEGLFAELDLGPGQYVVEVAPSQTVARPNDRYRVTAALPTAERTHADVQNLGNTGLGGAGMTLGQFLDARGSLIYGAHPDADPARATDPFYSESPDYPWLPFTTDRCSIPPAWILHLAERAVDRAAIRAGPLGWLAAQLLLPDADEVQDSPQFGGETVEFVYGCMRHDFNWRNLHRVKHHYEYDTAVGTWNDAVREDADARAGADLFVLCNANQDDARETSTHFTWELPNQYAIHRCETAATTIKLALGVVPFDWIGSTYQHD